MGLMQITQKQNAEMIADTPLGMYISLAIFASWLGLHCCVTVVVLDIDALLQLWFLQILKDII